MAILTNDALDLRPRLANHSAVQIFYELVETYKVRCFHSCPLIRFSEDVR